jgi:hypothetical protein
MKSLLPFAAIFAVITEASFAETALIESGQARAEIVIAETPARMAKLASRELQTYLEKISGARLEIVTKPDAGKAHIFVGKSRYAEALGLSTAGLENGAFRMASGEDWLALLGPDEDFVPIEPWGRSRSAGETARVNAEWDKITGDTFWNNCRELYTRYHADLGVWDYDDAGTLNAVYEFLRGLGVRWFAPGELGEVVPKQATIALPDVNRTVRPDFALRRFSYYTDASGIGELALWNLRLGLNYGNKLIGVTQPCHGIKFVLMREEMKKAHPEMYRLADGKRDTTHKNTGAPCLSSPLLFEKQLRYARAMLDHFQQPMISIDMVDGFAGLACDDESCRRQLTPDRGWPGSMSDYVWGYLNRVALELHKSHPDRLVSGLAYSGYKLPPEKIAAMSPNLALIATRQRSSLWDDDARETDRAAREAWLKKLTSGKYFVWDYCVSARPEQAGRPVFFPRLIARDLRELKGVSLGDTIEIYQHPPGSEAKFGYDPLAIEHLNLYVTARLLWDANQDLDALLDDYYARYYGAAREQMKALVEFSEANWMHMGRDAAPIGQAFTLLDAAQAAAEPQSLEGRRIQKIADLMKPLRHLQQQLGRKHESDMTYRVLLTSQAGGQPMKEKTLDGQLPKEFWPDVRVAPLVKLTPGARPKATSQFQILREGDILHFGIRCNEPDMRGANIATTTPDDPKLLEGDFVSLLIETPSRSYYEIAVNPAGTVLEVDRGENPGIKWSSGAQLAVHRGEDFWSIEIRLPIAGEGARVLDPLKGIDGAQPKDLFPWHFNVCRQRVRGSDIERTAYSPTGKEDFRVPEKLAKLWGK